MQPEAARLQDARAWLSNEISAPAQALWGDVLFHAQQAAGKAMKAFLAWHDVPFRKTHSIEELGRQCVEVGTGGG